MYMMGCSYPLENCIRMAPKLELDASVCTVNGCVKSGLASTGGVMKVCCRSSKSLCTAWSPFKECGCFLLRRSVKGTALVVKSCIKRL